MSKRIDELACACKGQDGLSRPWLERRNSDWWGSRWWCIKCGRPL